MTDAPRRPRLSRNWISEVGVGIAILGLLNLAFLIYIDTTSPHANPYIGILTWIVAPAILIAGIALWFLGILLERRRRRLLAPDQVPEYPRIDLNERRWRIRIIAGAIFSLVFVVASVIGSYHAYHYTDSDEFCGTVCHEVMHPEYTAYQASPHARVGCAGCHIGPGAGWFVRSKLSGAYQVYAAIADKYPRPIPTPVANLRPAQETCEQCHWPEKFFGAQLKTFDHFAADETNTPREVRMLIKTGGGSPRAGGTAGIHWHMNIENEVTYVATDRQRQVIPWVRMRNRQTGQMTEYRAEDATVTDAQIATAVKRTMDCVDCHNRPTHIYVSPDASVNTALRAGEIDRTLPYIKQQGVEVLSKDYASSDDAVKAIAAAIPAYYQENHPEVYASRKPQIDGAVRALQRIFRTTRFPEMKVDWRTHPDNVGHFTSAGCFRCHDDKHVSKDGKRISKDCDICHTVLPPPGSTTTAFEHPVDIGDLREANCAECHTGAGM